MYQKNNICYPETHLNKSLIEALYGQNPVVISENTITRAHKAVEDDLVGSVILPVESAKGGTVGETQEILRDTTLKIIGEAVIRNDDYTRLIELGKETPDLTGNDKTSIICKSSHDHPGSLVELLSPLAFRGISMTSLQSHRGFSGNPYFHIDFLGHQEDPNVSEAIKAMELQSETFKILGSYPVASIVALGERSL